ncbi:MAG TPA: nuclease, partial [Solibacterales bacterium]|nr:nuclease [Bryobacterales bacterium]
MLMRAVIVSAGVVALWVLPLIALAWISGVARRWFHSSKRRNPLTSGLLRGPGHTLRESLDELRYDMVAYVSVSSAMPLIAAAMYLALRKFATEAVPHWSIWFGVGGAGFLFGAVKVVQLVEKARNLRLGLEAECAVGEELNLLMKEGFSVFHDIPGDKAFNIDHVVVGPSGVFAVETKGRAKLAKKGDKSAYTVELRDDRLHFPDWTGTEPLDQAKRNADWVRKWLSSAIGEPVAVKPVLVFPGWMVERKGRSDVAVISGKECRSYFPKARSSGLAPKL